MTHVHANVNLRERMGDGAGLVRVDIAVDLDLLDRQEMAFLDAIFAAIARAPSMMDRARRIADEPEPETPPAVWRTLPMVPPGTGQGGPGGAAWGTAVTVVLPDDAASATDVAERITTEVARTAGGLNPTGPTPVAIMEALADAGGTIANDKGRAGTLTAEAAGISRYLWQQYGPVMENAGLIHRDRGTAATSRLFYAVHLLAPGYEAIGREVPPVEAEIVEEERPVDEDRLEADEVDGGAYTDAQEDADEDDDDEEEIIHVAHRAPRPSIIDRVAPTELLDDADLGILRHLRRGGIYSDTGRANFALAESMGLLFDGVFLDRVAGLVAGGWVEWDEDNLRTTTIKLTAQGRAHVTTNGTP